MTEPDHEPEPEQLPQVDGSKIRRANVGNIIKKLKAGRTLTGVEVKAIEAFEHSEPGMELVPMGWLCAALGLTKQRMAQLADAGVVVRHSRDKYKAQESIRNYVAKMRGLDTEEGIDWNIRIKKLEVEKREMEIAEMKGETITIEKARTDALRATAIWQMTLKAKVETEAAPRLLGKEIAELRAELRQIHDELVEDVAKAFDVEPVE